MHMRTIPIMLLVSWLSAVPVLAGESTSTPCLMQPPAWSIAFPARGFTWLPGGGFSGKCVDVPSEGWRRGTSGTRDLCVHIEGPEGSGRYWKVVVGVSAKQQSQPVCGTCIWTSTVGWRTLQRYSKGSLPWLDDVDDDGEAEFILWDSFALHEEASNAEYGLVAWVYRLVSSDSLMIDLELSRGIARSLAKKYRSWVDASEGYPSELCNQAAEALEEFAEEKCSVGHTEAHRQPVAAWSARQNATEPERSGIPMQPF